MDVNRESFVRFLEHSILKDKLENSQLLISIEEKSMTAFAKSPNGVVGSKVVLNGEFEAIGNIGIHDLKVLRDSINSFNDEEISMKVDKNKLVFTDSGKKHKVKILLRSEDYILNKIDSAGFDKVSEPGRGNDFTLSEEQIGTIEKYYKGIKSDEIILVGKDNELAIKLEQNGNEVIDVLEIDKIEYFKTKFSKFLVDLISTFGCETKVSVNEGSPAIFSIVDGDCECEYILAPLT